MTTSSFSAVDSLTGYLYQVRYALLDALKRVKDDVRFAVSLETLDDIMFETEGQPKDLLQAKHHSKPANLTDTSSELWKTIRIWIDRYKKGLDCRFFLITTSRAADGSAAYYLRVDNPDISKAISRLDSVAESSTSEANSASYDAYRSLTAKEKDSLFRRVTVLILPQPFWIWTKNFDEKFFMPLKQNTLTHFLMRLEGWWFRRALEHLRRDNQKPILAEEIIAEEANLREQFKQDNLVVDDDILCAVIDGACYQSRSFVQQLKSK